VFVFYVYLDVYILAPICYIPVELLIRIQ